MQQLDDNFPSTRTQAAQCEAHGEFEQRLFTPWAGAPSIRSKCPKCDAEAKAAAAEEAKRSENAIRKLQAANLLRDSGIPARFRDRTLAGYRCENKAQRTVAGVCRRFAEDFEGQCERGSSLVLVGGAGTGKTHLACAVAASVIETHLASARFETVSGMLRRIKETYRKDSVATESDVIRSYIDCDLLVLDEIGVQVGSEHEKLLLFEVLNGRYQALAPSILISNLAPDELETFLGTRVMDRFRECGFVLRFDWDSYRGRAVA
jgi:DNA replication protein DnaC